MVLNYPKHLSTMFALKSDSENVAIATAPLPVVLPKPRLQPLAGIAPAPLAAAPLPNPEATPATVIALAPQPTAQPPNGRATVFTSTNRPNSPWSDGAARVAPKPLTQALTELGKPASLPETDTGIEGVRKLLFGREMNEMQTRVAELQLSLNGELKRLREALMSRVDEMSGYLHRDMVVLRDEMQREMAQLKTDLFTAATGLSSVKDRLQTVESRTRDETAAALAELDGRLNRQETAFTMALDNIENKLKGSIEAKCAEALTVLAKKSDIAEILSHASLQVAKETPSVELGWFSAASATTPVSPTPVSPIPVPTSPLVVGGAWAALAKGAEVDGCATDWAQPANSFLPNESLIA